MMRTIIQSGPLGLPLWYETDIFPDILLLLLGAFCGSYGQQEEIHIN